jgi:hypothetical protein
MAKADVVQFFAFVCPPRQFSRPLWLEQAVQVSKDQGLARIRSNPHFSVDISRIKAYYSIVRMGKAKVQSDGAGLRRIFPRTADIGANAKAQRPFIACAAIPGFSVSLKRPLPRRNTRNAEIRAYVVLIVAIHALFCGQFVFGCGWPRRAFGWIAHADWGLGRIAPVEVSKATKCAARTLIIQYSIN